jgi:N-acyl-D-amino-acid deacylase
VILSVTLGTGLILLFGYYKYVREAVNCTGDYDLVIMGADIVDGLGHPAFKADVGIKDRHIACIGAMDAASAGKMIDASGLSMAPGFIDVHTHIERNFPQGSGPFLAPNFVRQGVTTVITGNCGRSAVPLREMLERLEKNGTQINVASLVGHNAIRQRVMRQATTVPSAKQLANMKQLVAEAMDDGALGISTGLVYIPGLFAKQDELVEVAKVAAGKQGLYVSHIRDEGLKGAEAIREAISIGKQADLPVHISHFKAQGRREWGSAQSRLDLVHAAIASGQRVTLDQYPYTASSTGLAVLMPSWLLAYDLNTIRLKLHDTKFLAKVRADMITDVRLSGWSDYSFAQVPYCDFDQTLNGLSISQISARADRKGPQIVPTSLSVKGHNDQQERAAEQKPAINRVENSNPTLERQADVVINLFARGGAQMVFFDMSEDDVLTIMREPNVMFGSDSGVRLEHISAVPHPRGLGTFPRVLGKYVRERHISSLEEAVRRMTSLPATIFQIEDRGQIRVGYWADIVLFDPNGIVDTATFERPFSHPEGISFVIVNGSVVFNPYGLTSSMPGLALRKRSAHLNDSGK